MAVVHRPISERTRIEEEWIMAVLLTRWRGWHQKLTEGICVYEDVQ